MRGPCPSILEEPSFNDGLRCSRALVAGRGLRRVVVVCERRSRMATPRHRARDHDAHRRLESRPVAFVFVMREPVDSFCPSRARALARPRLRPRGASLRSLPMRSTTRPTSSSSSAFARATCFGWPRPRSPRSFGAFMTGCTFHNHGPFDDPPSTELQCDLVALAWLRLNRDVIGISDDRSRARRARSTNLSRRRFDEAGRFPPFDLAQAFRTQRRPLDDRTSGA